MVDEEKKARKDIRGRKEGPTEKVSALDDFEDYLEKRAKLRRERVEVDLNAHVGTYVFDVSLEG